MKKFYNSFFLLTVFIVIGSTVYAQSFNITGPEGSGAFGANVTILSNGNYVVSDPYFDDGAIENVGAAYLYNGSTHTLISTLKGSTTNDKIGSGGIIILTNGHFVIVSSDWNNETKALAGAVTWGSSTTGISGVVNSSNSLVGSTAGDRVGTVKTLSNGNYVVSSIVWDNGLTIDAGAVTWGDGNSGTSGEISSSNSLVGSTAGDKIGAVTALSNGNYVVVSSIWDNGLVIDAGAATWGNGTTGTTGIVSISNSLVGSRSNHQIGSSGVLPLSDGNYVVSSHLWDNESFDNVGAVTWINGNTGMSGVVNSSNSLVGSTAGDQVGSSVIAALNNGSYVVSSPNWANGAIIKAGAVTWANGNTGISGVVSSSNSLIGSTANDSVGSKGFTVLSNGNYVISSPYWSNGGINSVGAVTWADGSTGISGVVSSSNSLIGSSENDGKYGMEITVLSNGNYIINSPYWNNGAIMDAGAITWGNGNTGTSGVISSSNSLVGGELGRIGFRGITALSNGNYVVTGRGFNNELGESVEAATWVNGSTGITGVYNVNNSLVGSSSSGMVAENGIIALSNGNYVVSSSQWHNGEISNAGAATWGNGNTGVSGVISSSNSFVGGTKSDNVGYGNGGITALSNGNYVINSWSWDNGTEKNVGAVIWANGNTGITGLGSSSNSLVGSTPSDGVGGGYIIALSNGNYVISSPRFDNGSIVNAGAITLGNGDGGVSGFITSCNSVMGTIGISTGSRMGKVYNPVFDYLIVTRPDENIITIFKPVALTLANSLDTVNVYIGGTTPTPLIASGGCRIIATLKSGGSSAVNGLIDAKTWIEPSVPTYLSQPFVARHYEITPATNATTATSNLTLYFTQQEFDEFNAHAGSILDLPANDADAVGKTNLRIKKFSGASSDGSGLPGTYSGDATVIDPADEDIVWNETESRWEVSFDVTGFSGFIVETSSVALPLTLLEFNGRLQNNNAVLNWKTENEQNSSVFEIERSIDERNFSSIGNVKAANTAGTHQYGFTDYNISTLGVPVVYYRLKQLDVDGRFVYSRIIALSVENKSLVFLYPNPAINEITLAVTVTKREQAQLKIIDNTGRVVKQKQVNLSTGSTSLSMDLTGLSKGMYYVELKGETINERRSFVKE